MSSRGSAKLCQTVTLEIVCLSVYSIHDKNLFLAHQKATRLDFFHIVMYALKQPRSATKFLF